MLWKLLSVTSDGLMTSWWKLHYGHFFVNIWDFMDPDFQFFRRIAFPFHLPPSDFLIGQLPRAWPFICWLFPLTELSMDALSSGFQLRPDFIWPWDLFCPVLWCLCMLNFSLYLAPFCRFCLFVHNYFFVAVPVSLTQPRWIIFRPFFHFYFFGASHWGFTVFLWLCNSSLVLCVPWRLYCLFFFDSVVSSSFTGFREETLH